jgi:A/G-specific adenine glycosylase
MFAASLLAWYDVHARVLPWRSHPSPYTTWVSEVMLQQTQVETVIPYFKRWMQRFPTLESLAAADQTEVLRLWEGLGYYSRARHLHQAAQQVVAQYAGKLPADLKTLLSLSGIGRYTAGAILSIAFDQKQPALDGNIRRVYARITNSFEPLNTTISDKQLWSFAESALPDTRAGDFNQALMDLGASTCTPQNPACDLCPIQPDCQVRTGLSTRG